MRHGVFRNASFFQSKDVTGTRMEPPQEVKESKVLEPARPVASFFRGLAPCRTPGDKAVFVLLFCGCVFCILCETGVFMLGRHPSFRCDDPLIQKKKLPEIVPSFLLVPFILIVPPVFLASLELRQNVDLTLDRPFSAGRVLRRYFCGLVAAVVLVQFLKEAVLEKRPHFLESCRPVEPSDRNGTLLCDGSRPDVLVMFYECSARKSHDAMTSFPSGHACIATYSSVFVVGYLQRRAATVLTLLWMRLTLLLLWAALGTFVSGSRIWDHMHHWWDVVAGAAMGSVFALTTLAWPQRL